MTPLLPRLCLAARCALVLLALAQCSAIRAAPSDYTISRVASTGVELSFMFTQEPMISETGSVLFTAELPGDINAVLLGKAGQLKHVTTWTSVPRTGIDGNTLGGKQVNRFDEVTFRGGLGGSDQNVYLWKEGAPAEAKFKSTGSPPMTYSFTSEPSINDQAQMAFVGSGQLQPTAVFVGDRFGTFPATVLASAGGPLYEGFTSFQQPQLVNDGTVFVRAIKNGVSGIHKLTAPGVSVPIVTVGAQFSAVFGPSPNELGDVAFIGRAPSGVEGIYVGDENGFTLRAIEGNGLTIGNLPGLNDAGAIIYRGIIVTPGNETDVLLTGPSLLTDRLITEGDLLFGEQVTQLFAGRGAINSAGQIAFSAQTRNLSTGATREGIYVATPVPEPGTFAMACLAAVFAGFQWRRRAPML